jgi:DNA repair photolyase
MKGSKVEGIPSGPIYVPKGHAAPFAQLALNPYLTCSFRCPYCYNAVRNPAFFSDKPRIYGGHSLFNNEIGVTSLLNQLDHQCARWTGEKHPVHMTFLGDCYQPAEEELGLTRRCIQILHKHGFPVQILTKSKVLPRRDFDLLGPEDRFGITLTGPDEILLGTLEAAAHRGIPIWLSLEPVIHSAFAIQVLAEVSRLGLRPDPLWIGPLNHSKRGYDWPSVKQHLRESAFCLDLTVRFKDSVLDRYDR